jgi:hypothetical protein
MAAVGGGMLHQLGVAQHLRERTQSHHRTVGTVRSAAGELRYAAAAGVLALHRTFSSVTKARRVGAGGGGQSVDH